MTPVFASRRRAEEFDSLVETPAEGVSRDARDAEFLEIVAALRDVPAPEPRPEFVASLREQLMTAADTLLVPSDSERLTLPARAGARDRRLAVAIGGFAVVGATTSMAIAAQSALPGEMLYPLKRAIENAEAGVATSRDDRAMALLDNASSRLAEVAELERQGELGEESDAVEATFVAFGEQATEAADLLLAEYADTGDRRAIRELRDFTAGSMLALEQLEAAVPEAAHDELVDAARVLTEIDARAERACPSCGGAGIDQIPPVLLAAGEFADTEALVVPGTTVDVQKRTRRAREDEPSNGTGDTTAGSGTSTPQAPSDPLGSTGVVTSPEGDGGGTSGGTGGDDPLGDLTDTLTGPGPSTSNPGGDGQTGLDDTVDGTVEELDETVDQTVDGLTDPLTGG